MNLSLGKKTFGQTDFRFLLPLQKGDYVCLWSADPGLVEVLRENQIQAALIANELPLPLENSSVDHIIAMDAPPSALVAEFARVIKRNGYIFIGSSNNASFSRLFRMKKPLAKRRSADQMQALLNDEGFTVLHRYGVRDSLQNPQFWIPLDTSAAAHYFWKRFYLPNSVAAECMRRMACMLSALGLHNLLFSDIALIARKK